MIKNVYRCENDNCNHYQITKRKYISITTKEKEVLCSYCKSKSKLVYSYDNETNKITGKEQH